MLRVGGSRKILKLNSALHNKYMRTSDKKCDFQYLRTFHNLYYQKYFRHVGLHILHT